jgi:hypothetical protein
LVLHETNKNSFFNRQPVGGLLKYKRQIGFDYGVGDFLAAVRRQAMHEERLLACVRQQLFIHLVGTKHFQAFGQFIFLAHAGPHVRVYSICTGNIIGGK